MPATQSVDLAGPSQRYIRNTLLSLCVFFGALALTHFGALLDIPLTHWLNGHADHHRVVDQMFYDFDTFYTYSGVTLTSLICASWFGTRDLAPRAAILMGTLVSGASAVASRVLQHSLHTHVRPMYDPTLGFHKPAVFASFFANTWNSFPSDHATVFFGLATVLFVARSRFRWPALLWMCLVETSRTYAGAHYPSDLLGGAALGSFLVWAAQAPVLQALGRRLVGYEQRWPGLFYLAAFFAAYQIATLTTDIRYATGAYHLAR